MTIRNIKNPPEVGASKKMVERRTIVKGATWSIPVIAATIAAPAVAASPPCTTQTQSFAILDATSSSGLNTTFVVPMGVTELTVTVMGGAGGSTFGSHATYQAGDGGKVVAYIPVNAGETLGVVVGQGGASRTATTSSPSVLVGGGGYGAGGNADPNASVSPPVPAGTAYWWGGGAGGGGSAILRGTQPLVIAGGGGGAGSIYGQNYTVFGAGEGGAAGSAGGTNFFEDGDGVGRVDIPGGLVGGGASGLGTITEGLLFATTLPGLATTTTHDGAVGGGEWVSINGTTYVAGAGAGGGGYAGGGSGSRAAAASTNTAGAALGAGGAGGTSFINSEVGVNGTSSTWARDTTARTRQGGTIIIEWCV